ncbi:hypothetical protein [Actinoplanes sp. N902-109]|uniref:hypothetical protein n=1 Tax=Actinoplanes sp. (strain N902-109) TaxID=649831 RepID=UPI0003295ECF|nr:hypothetical protein [Actinoplanes sp. N902-109]AGL13888.1 hypothetical protein L083_0378 [Actinoplanes sp. N902-109]
MPQWLRNLVMIVGLGTWLAVVVVTLLQGKLPDAILLGVPAGLVLALSPPKIGGGGGGASPPADTPATPPNGATS